MSHPLIDRSSDLRRLRDEGYELEIKSNYLLIHGIPYLGSDGSMWRGILVSELTLVGDITTTPSTHVVHFVGGYPCQRDGSPMPQIRHTSSNQQLAEGLIVNHSFSNKPPGGYLDYYHKMTMYIGNISGPAQSVDPSATAKTFTVVESEAEESVFNYIDTCSSRAGINLVSDKLKTRRIGIIGLGGTGSYVLDFVAKTPVSEIHLFDADLFLQHNAFRSPGAAAAEQLQPQPAKVEYFGHLYSKMHKNIIQHCKYIDASNADELRAVDFVFICVDRGSAKKPIIEKLEELGVPFVDAGMGIYETDNALGGIVRTTTSTPGQREMSKRRICLSDDDGDDDYSQNIQIAELNALNAALAVIKWKKLCGFYRDCGNEHHSLYTIDVDILTNEDYAA